MKTCIGCCSMVPWNLKVKVDRDEFDRLCSSVGCNPLTEGWSFEEANRDIATFVAKKLSGTAENIARSSGDQGFEILRLLNLRFDPLGA